MPRRIEIPNEIENSIVLLYNDGKSINYIANDTGYSSRVVTRVLNEKNVRIRSIKEQKHIDVKGKREVTREKVIEEYKKGYSQDEVAEHLNISRSYVRGILTTSGRIRKGKKKNGIIKLYKEGMTDAKKISEKIGCSKAFAMQVLREEFGVRQVDPRIRNDIDMEELEKMYRNGANMLEMQRRFNATWCAIHSRIEKIESNRQKTEVSERKKERISINVGDKLEIKGKMLDVVSINNNMLVAKNQMGYVETFTKFDVIKEFKKGNMRKAV